MKNIYIITAILTMIFSTDYLEAKNTRIGRDKFRTSVYKYPTIELPTEQTFQFELIAPGRSFGILPSSYAIHNFQIRGWNPVQANPAVAITTVMDDLSPSAGRITERCEVKERKVRRRDSSYTVKDTIKYFRAEMQVEGRAFIEARDARGELLFRQDLPGFRACTSTPEFCSRRAAKRYMDMNLYDIGMQHMNPYYRHTLSNTQRVSNAAMAHYEYSKNFQFFVFTKKSDRMYAQFNSKMNDMQRILGEYAPTQNKAETKRRLSPYIDYLQRISKMKVSDRRSKKIKFMALHNLATTLHIVEEYQQAGRTAQNWKALKYKKITASKLLMNNEMAGRMRAMNRWEF